jgi:hypothetical protein
MSIKNPVTRIILLILLISLEIQVIIEMGKPNARIGWLTFILLLFAAATAILISKTLKRK